MLIENTNENRTAVEPVQESAAVLSNKMDQADSILVHIIELYLLYQ